MGEGAECAEPGASGGCVSLCPASGALAPRASDASPGAAVAPFYLMARWRGAGVAASVLLLAGSVSFGVIRGGHLPAVAQGLADMRDAVASAAGFRVAAIALSGNRQITREEVLATAGITGRKSLLFFDVDVARSKLKTNPWIADATVLKLYPDRLQISITERKPFGLWQINGKVSVVAEDGTVLEPYVARRFTSCRSWSAAARMCGPRRSWPNSIVSRRSASRCAHRFWSRSGAGTCGSTGADEHGIWLAGTLRTGLSRDEVALIRANPPSGDWRRVNGQLDLVAAFCVCVPGYVVPRADLGMVASAEGEFALDALILGPMVASGEISEFDELLTALIDADTEIAEMAVELEAI